MSISPKLDDKIARIQTALESAIREKEQMEQKAYRLTEAQKFAIALHEKRCSHDHTEYCAWHYRDIYDPATWLDGFEHKNYLKRAKKILATGVDPKTALFIATV